MCCLFVVVVAVFLVVVVVWNCHLIYANSLVVSNILVSIVPGIMKAPHISQ